MDSVLIKNAKVCWPGSPLHYQRLDLMVENGKVCLDFKKEHFSGEVIYAEGMLLLPSLCDLKCHGVGIGTEKRETYSSLAKAARKGGIGHLLMLPNTEPLLDSEQAYNYASSQAKAVGLDVYLAAAPFFQEDNSLSEILSLLKAGVGHFASTGKVSSHQAKTILEYLSSYAIPYHKAPVDGELQGDGYMHEGPVATTYGVKTIPELAESSALERDLSLVRYTGGKLNVSGVSSKDSIEKIASAKAEGLDITASVHVMNLCFCDEDIPYFNTDFKVNPPLRSKVDQQALQQAVKEGIIDFIVSDHAPWDEEDKRLELDKAAFGTSTLEVLLPALMTFCKDISMEILVQSLALNPRVYLGISSRLENNATADFILLDPREQFQYSKAESSSLSYSSAFFGKTLQGRVACLVKGNTFYWQPWANNRSIKSN